MRNYFSKKVIFFLLCIALFSNAFAGYAAAAPRIFFETLGKNVSVESEFIVGIYINTPSPINAFDIEVAYDPTINFLGFLDQDSLVDVWQARENIKERNSIVLRGGLLRGYMGTMGEIMSLRFKIISPGTSRISFTKADLFLADGKGTKVPSQLSVINIPATNLKAGNAIPPQDNTAPMLSTQIVKNPIGDNFLLIFRASDKESGIQDSFVRTKSGFSWGEWKRVLSPVAVPSGTWEIQLKSINNAGLTTIHTHYIPSAVFTMLGLFMLVIILLMVLWLLFYNKLRR